MSTPVHRPIWFVCCAANTPCLYAADVVAALGTTKPRCLAHGALLLSWRRHDGLSREAVLEDLKGDMSPAPGQFEIGAMLRDRRRP